MSGRDPTWEPAAARVLSTLIAVNTIQEHDHLGGPPGHYDLDISMSDGRRIALEVTRSTDEQLQRFAAALDGGMFEASGLEATWALNVDEDARLNDIRQTAPRLLAQLEDDGIVEVDAGLGGVNTQKHRDGTEEEVGTMGERLLALGVDNAHRWPSPSPGRVLIMWPVLTAWENPDAVVDAIEERAVVKAEKLRRADADERHLFVWLDMLNWTAAMGFRSNRAGDARTPELPEGIDVVWVAMWIGTEPPRLQVWRTDRSGDGWQSSNVDPVVVHDLFMPATPDAS